MIEKLNIRLATIQDAQLLFDWANDPITRLNSFNTAPIKWADHVTWLNKKLSDPESIIYLVYIGENPIGVVKFDKGIETIIGVTVAPSQRGKGLGGAILRKACDEFWKINSEDVIAYIKKDNTASLRIFVKAGFKLAEERLFNHEVCSILKAMRNDS